MSVLDKFLNAMKLNDDDDFDDDDEDDEDDLFDRMIDMDFRTLGKDGVIFRDDE